MIPAKVSFAPNERLCKFCSANLTAFLLLCAMLSPLTAAVSLASLFTLQHFNAFNLIFGGPQATEPICNNDVQGGESVASNNTSCVRNTTTAPSTGTSNLNDGFQYYRRVPILLQFAPTHEECDYALRNRYEVPGWWKTNAFKRRYSRSSSDGGLVVNASAIRETSRRRLTPTHGQHGRRRKVPTVPREVDERIPVTCADVYRRGEYDNDEHSDFPIAYVRAVYKDYHIQELLLNLLYSRANVFCYTIDLKASRRFKTQMRELAKCFPNVFVSVVEYNVDSAGHNMDRSYLQCFRRIRHIPRWKYAILLQNDDIPLKTNDEIVAILKALNGSNDVGAVPPIKHRVPNFPDWTFDALQLFIDPSENDDRELHISKGSTAASLSRAFVEFVVDRLNLTTLLSRFDTVAYGVDEMLFPSLNAEDALEAPGGFTRHCVERNSKCITRYVVWSWSGMPCRSGRYRHHVCVFGLADIATLSSCEQLFANKMIAAYDYASIACWARHLYQRRAAVAASASASASASAAATSAVRRKDSKSSRKRTRSVDLSFYRQLPTVRYNNEKQKWQNGNVSEFKCS